MSPVAFIDANVPIYAAGWEYPYKEPCAATFILGAEHIISADTDFDRLPGITRLDPCSLGNGAVPFRDEASDYSRWRACDLNAPGDHSGGLRRKNLGADHRPAVPLGGYSGLRAGSSLAVLGPRLEEVDGSEDLYRLDRKGWQRLFDGVGLHPHLKSRIQRMLDLIAVDVFAFDQSVWSWQDGNNLPTFMLAQVPFDREDVAGKLQALDCKEADYAGTAYYWLDEDFAPGLFTHPLGLPLNRIAFLDDRIAAAPSTGILEQLIDVHHGESPSLLESEPNRALVEAVGEGLLGGGWRSCWLASSLSTWRGCRCGKFT